MYIESLELKNYRNYGDLSIDFDPKRNILYGDNAQGKTNILEALYYCGTTKSYRGSKDREVIQFQFEESHIKLFVKKNEVPYRIDVHLRKNKPKGIAINGLPIKRAVDLFGIVNFVFFSPEDLCIIKNGPSDRRKFMDMELCQIDKVYLSDLTNYNKIILQRNNLLKTLGSSYDKSLYDTLDIWDMQLVEYGQRIIERRQSFIDEMNHIMIDIHKKLTGGEENLQILYEPDVTITNFKEKLEKSREKDIRYKNTNVGPHRDDLIFLANEIDLKKFGSQGQQRTAALSLKLSEIELVKKMIHDDPILLLDDVMSELDIKRQNYLIDCIGNIQTIITCTGIDEFIEKQILVNKIYKIVNGTANLYKPERSSHE